MAGSREALVWCLGAIAVEPLLHGRCVVAGGVVLAMGRPRGHRIDSVSRAGYRPKWTQPAGRVGRSGSVVVRAAAHPDHTPGGGRDEQPTAQGEPRTCVFGQSEAGAD